MKQIHREGYTLVEIMIVVGVIALLAALALPYGLKSMFNARCSRVASEYRVAAQAFEMHSANQSSYPAETGPGVIPAGMEQRLEHLDWPEKTAIGGYWDWENTGDTNTTGVMITGASLGEKGLLQIDKLIDDGNGGTGLFRVDGSDGIYLLK